MVLEEALSPSMNYFRASRGGISLNDCGFRIIVSLCGLHFWISERIEGLSPFSYAHCNSGKLSTI